MTTTNISIHKRKIQNVRTFVEENSVHATFGPMKSNRPLFWSISRIINNSKCLRITIWVCERHSLYSEHDIKITQYTVDRKISSLFVIP